MEDMPNEAPVTCDPQQCQQVPVNLAEFIAVYAILQRSSIEAMAAKEGWEVNRVRLADFMAELPVKRRGERQIFGMGNDRVSLQNPSGLATADQNFEAMERLEQAYEKVTLRAVSRVPTPTVGSDNKPRPNLQGGGPAIGPPG